MNFLQNFRNICFSLFVAIVCLCLFISTAIARGGHGGGGHNGGHSSGYSSSGHSGGRHSSGGHSSSRRQGYDY